MTTKSRGAVSRQSTGMTGKDGTRDLDDDVESRVSVGVTDPDGMSEKQQRVWNKNLAKWRTFIDFLFRHVAVVTFKYNCFEKDELLAFMIALDRAEAIRAQTKLKKKEEPKITCLRVMGECTDILVKHDHVIEANVIKKFLDIVARMRGLATVAFGFYKLMKKGHVQDSDTERLKDFVDNWRGMCVRTFDYSTLPTRRAGGTMALNALEQRFICWPAALRTALNQAEKFLQRSCSATGLGLLSDDPTTLQKHMQAAEYVLASRIERVLSEDSNDISSPLFNGAQPFFSGHDKDWDLPCVDEVDPQLLRPILDDSLLLEIPDDLPKEKKRTKKSAKGARGKSASSKTGKKKKKK